MNSAAQRVHLQQRRETRRIAKVVSVPAARQRGTGSRFHGDHAQLLVAFAAQLGPNERERDAAEIRSAAGTADEHVRLISGHSHLLHRLQPNHGLVHQHVIQDAAQGVVRVLVLGRDFDRLGDGDAERTGRVGILGQNGAAGFRFLAGAGRDFRPVRLHQRFAVRLLFIAHAHHVDLAFEPEVRTAHGQRRAPLAGPGLGGQAFDASQFVVVGLRHGGIRLVRAGGADAFVLVVDPRGRAQCFSSRRARCRGVGRHWR